MKRPLRLSLFLLVTMPFFAACAGDIISVSNDPIVIDKEDPDLKNPALSWSAAECEAVLGSGNEFPVLSNRFDVEVVYTSSSSQVATVADNGTITLVGAGTTTITAFYAKDDTYQESTAQYILTVIRGEGGLAWSAAETSGVIGEEVSFPTLSNEHELEVVYSSSDEAVALISGSGEVTLVAAGTTVITASSAGNDIYDVSSASYTLTVMRAASGLEWSSSSASAIMDQEPVLPVLSNPNNLEISYSSSNEAVAVISEDGAVSLVGAGTGGKGISTGDYDYEPENHTLTDSYITGGVIRITTSGNQSNDVTCKGIKVGYKYSTGGSSGGGGGWGGWGGWGGNSNNTYGGNLRIDGGKIYISCAHAEGIEVKGTLTFNGGYVIGITTRGTPEVGLDAASENKFKVSIKSGATVVVYGGIERGYAAEQPVKTMNIDSGSWNGLWNGSEFVAAFKSPANVTSVTVSAPSLSDTAYKGVSVSGDTFCEGCWAVNGISGGTSVTLGN